MHPRFSPLIHADSKSRHPLSNYPRHVALAVHSPHTESDGVAWFHAPFRVMITSTTRRLVYQGQFPYNLHHTTPRAKVHPKLRTSVI